MKEIWVVVGIDTSTSFDLATFTNREKAYKYCNKLEEELLKINPTKEGHSGYEVHKTILNQGGTK